MSGRIQSTILHILRSMGNSIEDYCDIETVDDGRIIVLNDGSMVSLIEFNGSRGVMSKLEYDRYLTRLTDTFNVFFERKGHQVQVVMMRSDDPSPELARINAMNKNTAKKLSLDADDLIDETTSVYSNYCFYESCILALWTLPSTLSKEESGVAFQERNKALHESELAHHVYEAQSEGQNLGFTTNGSLRSNHLAFVNHVIDDMSQPEFRCSVTVLSLDQQLRAIRQHLLPDYTGDDWQAHYPHPDKNYGLRYPNKPLSSDLSPVLPPLLSKQLLPAAAINGHADHFVRDTSTVQFGNRVYAPLLMNIPPKDPQVFTRLFELLNVNVGSNSGQYANKPLPYSLSFMLQSDGMSLLGFRTILAGLLGFTSEQNKAINASVRVLKEYKNQYGTGSVVKFRLSAMTWVNIDTEKIDSELRQRKALLWRALESWGHPILTEYSGNPMRALQSNAIAMATAPIATATPAPLSEAMRMLPFTRPASPLERGSIPMRSLCGKVLWYSRFSTELTTWITLISGKPGSGKSVLMNSLNIDSCLTGGLTELPYNLSVDIGISSKGYIDAIREALPANLKHYAMYKRINNSQADAINPLDTQLGQRYPLRPEREFSVDFITMLVTSSERDGKPIDGMTSFVGRVIDEAYRMHDESLERSQPRQYTPNNNQLLDKGIKKLIERGISVPSSITYWGLVDIFFDHGMLLEAETANQFAVPTLPSLITASRSEAIETEYGNDEAGIKLIGMFRRGVQEAVSDFPVFCKTTAFDVGAARIIAIDLQNVAASNSSSRGRKSNSLFFTIARECLVKKIRLHTDYLPDISERYKRYFADKIRLISEIDKSYCIDEYHRTKPPENPNRQQVVQHESIMESILMTDAREARKWRLEITLASQYPYDFGQLTTMATVMFWLDAGDEATRNWLRDNVGLSDTEESAMKKFVSGAKPTGSTMMVRFRTKKNGEFSQLMTFNCGTKRLWSLATGSNDRNLRERLSEKLGSRQAREILSIEFPGGSADNYIENIKAKMGDNVSDDIEGSIIDDIVKRLIDAYNFSGKFDVSVSQY